MQTDENKVIDGAGSLIELPDFHRDLPVLAGIHLGVDLRRCFYWPVKIERSVTEGVDFKRERRRMDFIRAGAVRRLLQTFDPVDFEHVLDVRVQDDSESHERIC